MRERKKKCLQQDKTLFSIVTRFPGTGHSVSTNKKKRIWKGPEKDLSKLTYTRTFSLLYGRHFYGPRFSGTGHCTPKRPEKDLKSLHKDLFCYLEDVFMAHHSQVLAIVLKKLKKDLKRAWKGPVQASIYIFMPLIDFVNQSRNDEQASQVLAIVLTKGPEKDLSKLTQGPFLCYIYGRRFLCHLFKLLT